MTMKRRNSRGSSRNSDSSGEPDHGWQRDAAMTTLFDLQIRNQHWLGEPHEQSHDGCSHGGIRAVIGGTLVTSEEEDYGISTSALSLLRTLEQDHTSANPVSGPYLLNHGCNYPIGGIGPGGLRLPQLRHRLGRAPRWRHGRPEPAHPLRRCA